MSRKISLKGTILRTDAVRTEKELSLEKHDGIF